jgi:hypothetical protein
MTNYLKRLIAASVIVFALQSNAATAQSIFPEVKVPPVPDAIKVPAGNAAFIKGYAVGTQNYICQVSDIGFAWKFLGPQATLFYTFPWFNGEVAQQIATHFLSPNPLEGGTARATWQGSIDTSAVWGKAIASSPSPGIVPAIPWLLLEVVGSQAGPTGGTLFAQTTFIHRLNTTGGVIPSTGCSEAKDVGVVAFVPYTADYFFYKSTRAK